MNEGKIPRYLTKEDIADVIMPIDEPDYVYVILYNNMVRKLTRWEFDQLNMD